MPDDETAFSAELARAVEDVRADLEAMNGAREAALPLCRGAVRSSANCIRAVHRGDTETAARLLAEARAALAEAATATTGFPQIAHAGFVHDAQKEYAEAAITLALIAGGPLPTPQSLGVRGVSYLHGVAEAIGELRRHVLDSLRADALDRCEAMLERMDEMQSVLVTIDYPDAMTSNLRRATDVTRGIIERTRGDLTLAAQQHRLASRLDAFEARGAGGGAGGSP